MKLPGLSSLFSRDENGPGSERRSLFLALAALLVWGFGISLWSDAFLVLWLMMLSLSTFFVRAGGNAVSVNMEGLSSESLAKFLQETERRGIFSFSADIRAIRNTSSAAGSPPRSLTAVLLMGRR